MKTDRPVVPEHGLRARAAVRLPHLDVARRRRRRAPATAAAPRRRPPAAPAGAADAGGSTHRQHGRLRRRPSPAPSPRPVGPGAGADHGRRREDHRRRGRRSTRPATAGTSEINAYALPVLVQETLDAQSANIDMVSGATVTSDGYLAVAAVRARPGRAVTRRRGVRPAAPSSTSWACRSAWPCAAGTPTTTRPSRLGGGDGELREVDRGVQHLPRRTPCISRLGRGEIGRRRLPARGRRGARRWASRPRASPAARSTYGGPARRAARARPERGGQGLGGRARRRAPARPRRHRLLPVGRRRHGLPHRSTPTRPPWRIGIEDPARPEPASSPSSPCAPARSRPRAPPTAGAPRRRPHRRGRRPASPRSPSSRPSLTWADIDATAAFAQGPDAAAWLRTRPGRTGLVVWADGATTTVQGPARGA